MGRIRTVKPDLFKHDGLFDGEMETGLPLRLAFIGLWTQCDREGRFRWRPRSLKTDILPYDDVDISRVLDALATRGFVVKYACQGEEFGCIPSWHRHQVVNNRESKSEIPPPPPGALQSTEMKTETDASSTREARVGDVSVTRHGNYQGEGKGREGEGEGNKKEAADAAPIENPSDDPKPAAQKTDPVGSAEDRFWALKPKAVAAGIAASDMGQLLNAHNDRGNAAAQGGLEDLERALRAKSPKTYLRAIIRNLKSEAVEPDPATHRRPDDPSTVPGWVLERREDGAEIRWKPPNGTREGRWVWGREEYANDDREDLIAC